MNLELPDQHLQSFFPCELAPVLEAWSLVPDGALVTTRSSWVLPVRWHSEPAMLKVARIPDEQAGFRLMSWWNGQGSAKIHAAASGALLMERSVADSSLSKMARTGDDDEATRILCRTAAKLHAPRSEPFPELNELEQWFQPLFELAPSVSALSPAADAARELLSAQRDVRPLHGDLHHDNVMDFGERGWLAIDPKGLIGDRAFDYANIFINPDLADPSIPVATLPARFEARLRIVAQESGFEAKRILSWVVAWTGLSAAWFIGDGDHVSADIDLRVNSIARALRNS